MNVERVAYKAADGVQYAVVVVGAVTVLAGAASYLLTDRLVGLKWVLFLLGAAFIGVGAVKLRPTAAWRDEPRAAFANDYAEGGIGARVGRLPPVGRLDLEPGDRCSDGGRLFLAGVLAWAVSFGLEAVLGVGVPAVG